MFRGIGTVLKIELVNHSIFKDAFESISRIVDEVMIEVDSEGFRVNALDRSHITFVGLHLEPTVFDEFVCNVPEKLCLDTVDFMKILKRIKKNDVFNLEIDENNLVIRLEGDVTRIFKIKMIDLEYDTPELPNIELPCKVELPSVLLKDCLTDMELFSDVLTFSMDEDYFFADVTGEFGDSNFKFIHGEDNSKVSSKFSISKLKDMISASKFSEDCIIRLGDDMPLILSFNLPTGDGELKFLLAPRLSEEE